MTHATTARTFAINGLVGAGLWRRRLHARELREAVPHVIVLPPCLRLPRFTRGPLMKKQPAKKGRTGAQSRSRTESRPSRPSGKRPLGSTVKLPREWVELINLLSSNGVRFVVVGAHALAANGRPRATQDIDLLVEPVVADHDRVVAGPCFDEVAAS